MSLSFLVPAFFAGLLALAIPILVHLSRRQAKDPIPFPSLMFLRNLPQQTTERRRIHRWPLLLLRMLALILLILAFSRPFLERDESGASIAAGGDREVVVLLDRSYSMGMGDRWDQAVTSATEVFDGLSGADRGTLILFDSNAESATESTTDRSVLRNAVQSAAPSVRTTRYAPALRYASRILGSSPLPRHELVVISDFQRSGWDADVGEMATLRLPVGTEVKPISVVGMDSGANLTIAGADFDRETVADRERAVISARISSSGAAAASVPVTLELDGRVVETREVGFGEGNTAVVRFNPITLPEAGSTRGVLRIPEDALAIDNVFHFVLSTDQRIGVLVVDGPGTPREASFFLERALALGNAPGFRTQIRRTTELRSADLIGNPVVILNQAALPGGEAGERLRAHVEQGGGLILVLGSNAPGDWQGVLPNIPGAVDRTASGGVALGYIDTGHPVFEAFAGPRTGDFTSARIYRYRPLPTDGFPRILAKFGDGGAALAEQPVGEGRVLVLGSTLDGSWNDLTLQPVFLPFLHQLVKYAAGYTPPRNWLTVGDPFDVRGTLPPGEELGLALTPSSRQTRLTAGSPLLLDEVGFYELRDDAGSERLMTVAVNVDPGEAEQTTFDPEEMRSTLLAAASLDPSQRSGLELTLEERERQQSGWWYLVVAAFVLLAAETMFSNRREAPAWLTRRRGGDTDNSPGLAS